MQRARRRDPYPFMWEVPLAVAVTVGLILVMGVHVGRAVANLLAGGGWALTPSSGMFISLVGVLGGDASAGLSADGGPFASAAGLWACIVVTECVLIMAMALVANACLDRWGPWRMRGMASPGEAERLLGLTRLRRVSAVVRPDLYGPDRRTTP